MSEDKIREAIVAQIIKLRLGGNQITDLTPLKGLTNLKTLWLKDHPISDDQKEMLKKALSNCNVIF